MFAFFFHPIHIFGGPGGRHQKYGVSDPRCAGCELRVTGYEFETICIVEYEHADECEDENFMLPIVLVLLLVLVLGCFQIMPHYIKGGLLRPL